MPSRDYDTCADLPSNTCPIIDAALSEILENSLEDIDFDKFRKLMEQIREANADLRSEANRLEEVANNMGSEIDDLETTIDELKEERDDLQKQLDELNLA